MSLSLRLRYQQASFAPFASATKPNPQDKLESQRPQVSLLTHLAQTNSSSSLQSPQADSNRNPTHLPKSSWRSPQPVLFPLPRILWLVVSPKLKKSLSRRLGQVPAFSYRLDIPLHPAPIPPASQENITHRDDAEQRN